MLLMANDKKKPGRGRPQGRKVAITIQARVPPALAEALDLLAESTRRTKQAELIIALENHLKAANLWPPKDAQAEAKDD